MPRYRTEVAHTLGRAEALARLKALAERAGGAYNLKGTWSENTFDFSLKAQGVGLRGTLTVEPDVLKFDGRLPLLAMPFRNWIPRVLKKGLEQAGAHGVDVAPPPIAEPDAPAVLFLHIPKAGGMSLGEYVYNQCCADEPRDDGQLKAGVAYLDYGFIKEPGLAVPEHVRRLLQRSDLRAVIGHFWFGLHEHVARPHVYVTLLRDPFERVVSLYHYAKLHETMSLEEFLRAPPFKEVDNDQTRRLAGQDPPLGRLTRAALDTAKENLRRYFAVVGTVERFDETLALLRLKLGWTREVVSYPRNVNRDRPPLASFPREAIEAVRARNELDLELWQYASQLMDEAIETEGQRFGEELARYKALASV